MKFKRLLSDFGMCQHALAPTHNRAGLLDHIITRKDDKIQNFAVVDLGLSDHRLIACKIDISVAVVDVGLSDHRRVACNIDISDAVVDLGLSDHRLVVCNIDISVAVVDVGLSDHRLIACDIDISPPTPVYDSVISCSWRCFDVNAFRQELNG